jgi:CheY-like chemotaxis protein
LVPQLWRIIVVEDDPIIAIGLQDMLESIGCEVAARASSVLSALRLLQRLPLPQGAVLDCNLGGEKVWPVADVLSGHRVPFIFCTGYGTADISPRFAAVPVLAKPCDIAALKRVFLPLLRHRE